MVFQALGHLLPISVAVAISSVPIMATILLLLSPNRKRSALPFLIGWVFGIAFIVTLFTVFARALPAPPVKQADVGAAIALILIGIALVVFGFILWRRSSSRPVSEDMPKWLRAIGSLNPWAAFGVAFGLNFRPKSLLLSVAAGISLRGARLTVGETAFVLGVYTLIACSTVVVPIIFTLIAPARSEKRLLVVRGWMVRNNRIVSILIMMMIGVVIIGSGLTRL